MSTSGVVLATGGYGSIISFWDASTGKTTRDVSFVDSQVNVLSISPDKLRLAAGGNPKVRLFETSSNNPNAVNEFEGHTSNVTSLGFQKDARWIYSGSEDGTIRIFDARAGAVQRTYETKNKIGVNSVALHPNQAQLLSADNGGSVRVWDLIADKMLCQVKPELDDVSMRSVAVASNGSAIVACNNVGHCMLWKMDSLQSINVLGAPISIKKVHDTYCLKVQFSPDVSKIATASADKTVRLWETPQLDKPKVDWTSDMVLSGHNRWVHDMAFSADSSYLVSACSDGSARLWDLSNGKMIRQYTCAGSSKAIVAVALNDSASD